MLKAQTFLKASLVVGLCGLAVLFYLQRSWTSSGYFVFNDPWTSRTGEVLRKSFEVKKPGKYEFALGANGDGLDPCRFGKNLQNGPKGTLCSTDPVGLEWELYQGSTLLQKGRTQESDPVILIDHGVERGVAAFSLEAGKTYELRVRTEQDGSSLASTPLEWRLKVEWETLRTFFIRAMILQFIGMGLMVLSSALVIPAMVIWWKARKNQ